MEYTIDYSGLVDICLPNWNVEEHDFKEKRTMIVFVGFWYFSPLLKKNILHLVVFSNFELEKIELFSDIPICMCLK